MRAAMNVIGDAFAVGVVAHLSQGELAQWDLDHLSRTDPLHNNVERMSQVSDSVR